MSKHQFFETEKRLLYKLVVVDRKSVREAIEVMRERFGRAPTEGGAYAIISRIRDKHGLPRLDREYPLTTKELAVELARTGEYRTTLELLDALSLRVDRTPAPYTVARWIRKAGVELESTRAGGKPGYSQAAREEYIRLYLLNMPLKEIRARIVPLCGGRQPSRGWCHNVIEEAGVKRKKNASATRLRTVAKQSPPMLVSDWQESERRSINGAGAGRLWWSPETSTNPRWNPEAGQQAGRLAA